MFFEEFFILLKHIWIEYIMKKYVLIVAGGKGLRMGNGIPKQFLLLAGQPVLMHTIKAFYKYDTTINIILILPKEQQDYWSQLCVTYAFDIPHQVTSGGETRFHSVKNGLLLVGDEGYVAVHDGVRPFVSKQVIADCFLAAEKCKAVIPVTDVVETIRETFGKTSQTVDRNKYKLVQTPQVFEVSILKKAYQQNYTEHFTDDASVVESLEEVIHLVTGNKENIKITTPFDLLIGEAILMSDKI